MSIQSEYTSPLYVGINEIFFTFIFTVHVHLIPQNTSIHFKPIHTFHDAELHGYMTKNVFEWTEKDKHGNQNINKHFIFCLN